ncbi:MAG: TrkH family potassium uptake protein [Mangrovibacterium sp.]
MFNVKGIFRILGSLLIVECLCMLISALVGACYDDGGTMPLLQPALITFAAGGLLVAFTRNAERKIHRNDGFIIVTMVWILFSFFGSLPYLLSGGVHSLADAFFETMSGFTTTGSSILNNIEALPHGILFWRSLTQWLGGMGIIVLSLAILPIFGIGGMQLFSAEVPGPVTDKINPKIQATAKYLWLLYLGFTLLETILLWIGGMSLFDAVNHSFTTMATGGYSTKQDSIAHWDSAYIQYVIILFMIIAGTNFALMYGVIIGEVKKLVSNEEFRFYIGFIAVFTVLVGVGLYLTTGMGGEKSFRDALFQVVSIITTTGFATTDYMLWKPILIVLIFAAFFLGGSAGSTGGGIKIMRIVLLLKNSYYELRRMLHPNAVIPVRHNGRAVPQPVITNVLAFFMIYILIFTGSTLVFTWFEPDLATAMSAVATSLGNIGPGLGELGPAHNFAVIHDGGKWFLSFLMLLGRLELFTVLVLFSPAFWKK